MLTLQCIFKILTIICTNQAMLDCTECTDIPVELQQACVLFNFNGFMVLLVVTVVNKTITLEKNYAYGTVAG